MAAIPGQGTFENVITRFRNRSIHTYVGHWLTFRGQVLQDGEFGVQSGWDTATNKFLQTHLLGLDYLRRKITHNPQNLDILTLKERAKDLKIKLPDDQNDLSPAGDEVARTTGSEFNLPYALDGSDSNIPMLASSGVFAADLHTIAIRNVDARMFVTLLDQHISEATRLDSRHATFRITPYESLMLYGTVSELWDIVHSFGGDDNRLPIVHGVQPGEEPRGPGASPNRETTASE